MGCGGVRWGDAVGLRVGMGVPVDVGGGRRVSNMHLSRGSERM